MRCLKCRPHGESHTSLPSSRPRPTTGRESACKPHESDANLQTDTARSQAGEVALRREAVQSTHRLVMRLRRRPGLLKESSHAQDTVVCSMLAAQHILVPGPSSTGPNVYRDASDARPGSVGSIHDPCMVMPFDPSHYGVAIVADAMNDVTQSLSQIEEGDPSAAEQLPPLSNPPAANCEAAPSPHGHVDPADLWNRSAGAPRVRWSEESRQLY